ncbi:hypothetical protein BpHYR1_000257 [Brachionus plicatilis]|uniref:Uncharacterized protein n=1 Tax=Brachionus plicatilis TaxID=10195 RepID=A0A3M7R6F4_BRAPC|nr:hypothetical protein BpHYR1_000257 [Brachionus plicatilis]
MEIGQTGQCEILVQKLQYKKKKVIETLKFFYKHRRFKFFLLPHPNPSYAIDLMSLFVMIVNDIKSIIQ